MIDNVDNDPPFATTKCFFHRTMRAGSSVPGMRAIYLIKSLFMKTRHTLSYQCPNFQKITQI